MGGGPCGASLRRHYNENLALSIEGTMDRFSFPLTKGTPTDLRPFGKRTQSEFDVLSREYMWRFTR